MNQLSWLIYLADVAGQANAITGCLFLVGSVAALPAFAIYNDYERSAWDSQMRDYKRYGSPQSAQYPKPDGDRPPLDRPFGRLAAPLAIAGAIFGAVSIAIPSSDTVYAVAASEMGERMAATETASKALKALNAWLDRQITPAPAAKP